MIYVKMAEGETAYVAIAEPVFVTMQRNGVAVRTDKEYKAQAVLDPKGEELWQIQGRELLPRYSRRVELVSREEYEQWSYANSHPTEPDPEDTEPVVPEGVEEESILTRAELTERVNEMVDALAMILSGVTEDEADG